ncbi:MAG: ATPase domain-containing protein [Candidatus Bathyarchaeia archaeon]|nr:hypothetical protein [Candidatus Bathyarchaeota archaeon]
MKVISLGITDLDRCLGGGFPHPCLASIEGEFGSGKTVLTQRIVYSMLREGLRVYVITTETASNEYIEMMRSINMDVSLKYVSGDLHIFPLHVERGRWTMFLASLFFRVAENFLHARKDRYDAAVIDSLSILAVNTPPHVFLTFITRMKNLVTDGKTIILTFHPRFLSEDTVMKLKASSDVYLVISNARVAGMDVKLLRVVKLWGTPGERKSTVTLEVNPHFGLRVLPLGGIKV